MVFGYRATAKMLLTCLRICWKVKMLGMVFGVGGVRPRHIAESALLSVVKSHPHYFYKSIVCLLCRRRHNANIN